QEVLEMAEAQDLSRLGFVMVSLRHRLSRLEDDWEQMKGAVAEWNSEAERQSLHLPINFGILLKQASVLLGLLSASPGFDSCLGRALEDARRLRPSEALYQSSLLYIHGVKGQHLKLLHSQTSTFARLERANFAARLEEMRQTAEMLSKELSAVRRAFPDASFWCHGTSEIWAIHPDHDPCLQLARDVRRLRGDVLEWLRTPQEFLQRFGRWQFSVAPNVSRIEVLTDLLEHVHVCTSGVQMSSRNLSSELGTVAENDEASLNEEYALLQRGARKALAIPVTDGGGLGGLLGVVRCVVEAQYVIHLALDEASTWAFRVKTRGNGLQLRLEEVAGRLAALHDALKTLPHYRALAFKEIHAAGHWGRSTSGGERVMNH
ncbi:unnamed protein product, partial [Effrenium voratum]